MKTYQKYVFSFSPHIDFAKRLGLVAALLTPLSVFAGSEVIHISNFNESSPSLGMQDYQSKWINPYGLGEMQAGGSRTISQGVLNINAAPFRTSWDFSVFDHIKYFALGVKPYDVPSDGSLMFSADIWAETPGVVHNLIMRGTYIATGEPFEKVILDSQQAFATIHLIDFSTGQLFDWFVYDGKASALTERLPSNVTGSASTAEDPHYVGRDKMYTQIIGEYAVPRGDVLNTYSIRYNRTPNHRDTVDFLINGTVVTSITNIGIPLDRQGIPVSTYPSLGEGELLDDQIHNFSVGHGIFSLLDEFPFQHPDAPELAVSIPIENRIFRQGVNAKFDNLVVKIKSK